MLNSLLTDPEDASGVIKGLQVLTANGYSLDEAEAMVAEWYEPLKTQRLAAASVPSTPRPAPETVPASGVATLIMGAALFAAAWDD